MKSIRYVLPLFLVIALVTFSGCSDDDAPPVENQEEEITRVTATFLNLDDDTEVVTAVWFDQDGEGSGAPVIDDIMLKPNTPYFLTLSLENTLETPAEDITIEVEEEGDEHIFFFGFTDGLFMDPSGDGNIDTRSDDMNYVDLDDNQQPVGLETTWITDEAGTGTFRVILKHQPDIKSATSTSADGESDVDITFPVIIE
jgi:hypothetical protein